MKIELSIPVATAQFSKAQNRYLLVPLRDGNSSSIFQFILFVLSLLLSYFPMFERNMSERMNDGWGNIPCL